MKIVEEINLPHPQCPCCNILVTCTALNGRQPKTAQCKKGEEINRHGMAAEELQESTEHYFRSYELELTLVTSFKFLDRIIMYLDRDWPTVVRNLGKAQKKCYRLTRILVREGANTRVSGTFFNMVAQSVLIFGSYIWVMTPHMCQSLGVFQHKVSLRMTVGKPLRRPDGRWEYPYLEEAMQ